MTRPTCIIRNQSNYSLLISITFCAAFLLLSLGVLSGCGARVSNHGHVISESELNRISIGVTSRADILGILGPPSFDGAFDKKKIYYSSQIMRQPVAGFKEVDERIIYIFTLNDEQLLESIDLINKEDGLVIAHIDAETPTPGYTYGAVEQVFTNLRRRGGED